MARGQVPGWQPRQLFGTGGPPARRFSLLAETRPVPILQGELPGYAVAPFRHIEWRLLYRAQQRLDEEADSRWNEAAGWLVRHA